jgi:hypothetical protein
MAKLTGRKNIGRRSKIDIRVFTAALGLVGLSSDHGWLEVEAGDRQDSEGRNHLSVAPPSR